MSDPVWQGHVGVVRATGAVSAAGVKKEQSAGKDRASATITSQQYQENRSFSWVKVFCLTTLSVSSALMSLSLCCTSRVRINVIVTEHDYSLSLNELWCAACAPSAHPRLMLVSYWMLFVIPRFLDWVFPKYISVWFSLKLKVTGCRVTHRGLEILFCLHFNIITCFLCII